MQRRLKSFRELTQLNTEVCALQREMHELLARCPLFVSSVPSQQKARLFGVLVEYLHEAVTALSNLGPGSTTSAHLSWLIVCTVGEVAISDIRSGALCLAAILDIEAVASLLTEQALPALLTACPVAETKAIEDIIAKAIESLHSFVAGRDR